MEANRMQQRRNVRSSSELLLVDPASPYNKLSASQVLDNEERELPTEQEISVIPVDSIPSPMPMDTAVPVDSIPSPMPMDTEVRFESIPSPPNMIMRTPTPYPIPMSVKRIDRTSKCPKGCIRKTRCQGKIKGGKRSKKNKKSSKNKSKKSKKGKKSKRSKK
jgi:hypothetical protein